MQSVVEVITQWIVTKLQWAKSPIKLQQIERYFSNKLISESNIEVNIELKIKLKIKIKTTQLHLAQITT